MTDRLGEALKVWRCEFENRTELQPPAYCTLPTTTNHVNCGWRYVVTEADAAAARNWQTLTNPTNGEEMSAPVKPTKDEIEVADFYWEYDQAQVDISTLADPPGSVPPHIVVRRRMVSQWETFDALTVTAKETPDD